ncbi:MAG: response regulator [Pirellulales bacterium]
MHHVLDVGNCSHDHHTLRHFIESHFSAKVSQAESWHDAQQHLAQRNYSLVLVNRLLDADGTEGVEVIRQLKQSEWSAVPAMLVTNFPDHQQLAVDVGALPGFGKLALGKPEVLAQLAAVLP